MQTMFKTIYRTFLDRPLRLLFRVHVLFALLNSEMIKSLS